jgi:hypothetical protein
MELHNPGNTYPIPVLYAWVTLDARGNEGIAAGMLPGLGTTPLVAGNEGTARKLRVVAETIAHSSGYAVRLVKFTTREVVEEIVP